MCSDVKTYKVLALLFRCLRKILSAKIEKNVICCSGSLTQFLILHQKIPGNMQFLLFVIESQVFWWNLFCFVIVSVVSTLNKSEYLTGYFYDHVLAICNNGCLNGNCTRPNVCTCNQGYRGSTCATRRLLKCCKGYHWIDVSRKSCELTLNKTFYLFFFRKIRICS